MRTLTFACERHFSLPVHRIYPMPAAERPTIRCGMNSLPQHPPPRLRAAQALLCTGTSPLYVRIEHIRPHAR